MAVLCLSAFSLQSCFQKMDRPDFDYPESSGEVPTTSLLLYLPFDDEDESDKGEYGFIVADNGYGTFVTDGVTGTAYQGSIDAYILATKPSILGDELSNLGSFTVAFWMKSSRNTSAQGIFCIPNTIRYWGNLDIYLENTSSETQAYFKVHIADNQSSGIVEKTANVYVDDVFGTEWVHIAFIYDESNSMLTVYRNGEQAYTEEFTGFEALEFADAGETLAISAFQFSTSPELTSGTTKPTWADNYHGQLDQFRFYNEALTAADVQELYNNRE